MIDYKRKILSLIFLAFLTGFLGGSGALAGTVGRVTVEGVINPVSARLITNSIDEAEQNGYQALVIFLDTPGGLLSSTRTIVKRFMASRVPIVLYVAPTGARAASAGVFITMAAHVAVMAEGTHIGAAHPVTMGGQMSETMEKKAENDAVSFIRSIADTRGRNADWGEAAVRESESITSTEALENSVIDMICPSFDSLLVRLHGREVKTVEGTVTLDTRDALVVEKKTGWRYKLLSIIADPNIAYILMVLGFYGLLFELSNPGSILPGVVGGICLILAFFALQVLPLNWAGLFLILFAIILFIAEVKVTSYGLLTVGGVISFLVGSLMLFQDAEGDLGVSLRTVLPVTTATVLFFVFIVYKAIRAQRLQPTTGAEGMVGLEGIVRSLLQPAGQVMVHGELWEAECAAEAGVGDKIKVTGVRGLTLLVDKLNQEDGT